jgi:hypothetical protein
MLRSLSKLPHVKISYIIDLLILWIPPALAALAILGYMFFPIFPAKLHPKMGYSNIISNVI